MSIETVKDIEWCASWDCPSCEQTTDQVMDHEAIEEYDGAVIRVTCSHNVDNGDHESPLCGTIYLVDLRG